MKHFPSLTKVPQPCIRKGGPVAHIGGPVTVTSWATGKPTWVSEDQLGFPKSALLGSIKVDK